MIIEALSNNFATAYDNTSVAIAKWRKSRLLKAQVKVVVGLHLDWIQKRSRKFLVRVSCCPSCRLRFSSFAADGKLFLTR